MTEWALVKRLEHDALAAAAPFRDQHAARVWVETDLIWARAEELRADPDQRPTGPYADAITREVRRLISARL
jgi:hypothetical protein